MSYAIQHYVQGVLDILLTQHNGNEPDKLFALRQQLQNDHAFLKVLGECMHSHIIHTLYTAHLLSPVLSGYCYHNCHSGQEV